MSNNKNEQAVAYAALILADDSVEVTPEKLQTILSAAGIDDVEPIWTTLFAKALQGKDTKKILTQVTASRPAIGETAQRKENESKDEVVGDVITTDANGDDDDDDGEDIGDLFGDGGLFG